MQISPKEMEKLVKEDGWFFVKQVGSHKHYKHPSKPGKVTIPFSKDPIPKGTANSILHQVGLK